MTLSDRDKLIDSEDFQYLSQELIDSILDIGSVLTWLQVNDADKQQMSAIGFIPPSGTIVKVNDPDGRITWWNLYSAKDSAIVEEIEESGSMHVYMSNHKAKEKIKQHHFKLTLSEYIIYNATNSEYEDTDENRFLGALTFFTNVQVIGKARSRYDDYRCFTRLNFGKASLYEYERWFYSMLDLASDDKTDCFLQAELNFRLSNEYSLKKFKQMFDELFPQIEVIYRKNGCTFRVNTIRVSV